MTKLKKIIGYSLLFLTLLFTVEISARAFLMISYNTSFFNPDQIIYHYYPMVKNIKEQYEDNSRKKILILSSSALTDGWGGFAKVFENEINKSLDEWDVYNAAGVGFSSLDNLNTLKELSHLQFDVILFYNGINDSRLNNCPDEVFQSDYSHMPWNNEIKVILNHQELKYTVIPFFFDFSFQKIKAALSPNSFLAANYHDQEDWQQYGASFKSLSSFKENIEFIKTMKSSDTKLILASFATYVPENYSFEKFVNKTLDYNYHANSREVEVWGEVNNVISFMKNLNAVLSTFDKPDEFCYYYDIRMEVKDPKNFADICHYSEQGINNVAKILKDKITNQIEQTTP